MFKACFWQVFPKRAKWVLEGGGHPTADHWVPNVYSTCLCALLDLFGFRKCTTNASLGSSCALWDHRRTLGSSVHFVSFPCILGCTCARQLLLGATANFGVHLCPTPAFGCNRNFWVHLCTAAAFGCTRALWGHWNILGCTCARQLLLGATVHFGIIGAFWGHRSISGSPAHFGVHPCTLGPSAHFMFIRAFWGH